MRKIINFNAKWAFTKMADEVPKTMPEKWDWVNLPHTWNAIDGQDGGNDYYRGKCYYAKRLNKADLPTAERYYLEIGGANSSAEVYVNGEKLARHDGGYSTWRVNLTDALQQENLIVIAVDNSANETVYPQTADFTFYGGLYRDVSIICTGKTCFDLDYYGGSSVWITPKIINENAKIEIKTRISGLEPCQRLHFRIFDAENNEVAQSITQRREDVLFIENVHRWHGRKDPYLYKLMAEILEEDQILDNVCLNFGCRDFEIDPDRGFILNGEEYPLRGVARHQDRWGVGNALTGENHQEDMDLICEMGANTIRLAHYQHDQFFYDLCDARGMVVWAEIPYISRHMPEGRENTVSQMKELIIQNYNHPSIVVWGLSNEITINGSDEDLLKNHELLNGICHEMDKTRQTVIACLSTCDIEDPYIRIPDAVSYNHYFGWYGGDTAMNGPWFDRFHERHPDIPIGCSEYGCEGLNWHSSNPVQGDYTEEYQAYYHEELIKQLFSRKYLWATHVWNMFDFGADARNEGGENGQNHKGLVTFDRKYKKDAFYAYKAWLSDEPFVHICGKRYIDRVDSVAGITVYSNQPEVELFANGKSMGKKQSVVHFFYFEVPNEGETHLLAVAGERKDEGFIRRVEIFNEAYRLKEKNAVLNWFDISEKEGFFSLNDKIGDILAVEEGRRLLENVFKQDTEKKKFEISPSMMEMVGGFTLLRLSGMMGTMGKRFDKEELISLNEQLNRIKKVDLQK